MSTGKEETIARLKEQIDEETLPVEEVFLVEDVDLKSEIEEVEVVEEVEEEEETVEGRSSYREYVVLVQKDKSWTELARNTATNAESAVRMLKEIEKGLVYVAVPVRNWNPLPPAKVETTTTISFG